MKTPAEIITEVNEKSQYRDFVESDIWDYTARANAAPNKRGDYSNAEGKRLVRQMLKDDVETAFTFDDMDGLTWNIDDKGVQYGPKSVMVTPRRGEPARPWQEGDDDVSLYGVQDVSMWPVRDPEVYMTRNGDVILSAWMDRHPPYGVDYARGIVLLHVVLHAEIEGDKEYKTGGSISLYPRHPKDTPEGEEDYPVYDYATPAIALSINKDGDFMRRLYTFKQCRVRLIAMPCFGHSWDDALFSVRGTGTNKYYGNRVVSQWYNIDTEGRSHPDGVFGSCVGDDGVESHQALREIIELIPDQEYAKSVRDRHAKALSMHDWFTDERFAGSLGWSVELLQQLKNGEFYAEDWIRENVDMVLNGLLDA